MIQCIVKNGLVLAAELLPGETLNLEFIERYMNQGSENYMVLVKDEEQLYKIFPNHKSLQKGVGDNGEMKLVLQE